VSSNPLRQTAAGSGTLKQERTGRGLRVMRKTRWHQRRRPVSEVAGTILIGGRSREVKCSVQATA
jgi:hypothetical protein